MVLATVSWAMIEVWHWTGIVTPAVHWNQWASVPAPVRFNCYFMSVLTFEAVSGRMVGRGCWWRSYEYSPRKLRKISPLHSLGHLLRMEGRSTLRKRCTGISLLWSAAPLGNVLQFIHCSHSQKVFYNIVFLQFSVIMMVDILHTIWALSACTATLRLFFDTTVLKSCSLVKHSY